jgi:hypothetical protein
MRAALRLGVPIAAGLATGGYALSQGEDPGSAALAGLGGVAGGAAGLLGARMAGKYMAPYAGKFIGDTVPPIYTGLKQGREGGLRQKLADELSEKVMAIGDDPRATDQLMRVIAGKTEGTPFERNIQKGIAAVGVPTSAALAGLGGVALGAIPGAMGMPGFQQQAPIDPERPGSSNTLGARNMQPSMQYV